MTRIYHRQDENGFHEFGTYVMDGTDWVRSPLVHDVDYSAGKAAFAALGFELPPLPRRAPPVCAA